jgi:NitT/TauT family transport system substrate-binding protein
MPKFRIVPHNRLQEWVADEQGYFAAAGLDYGFVTIPRFRQQGGQRPSADGGPDEVLFGALESMRAGRACDVSGACHWAINITAASGRDRMWGRAYSVAPGGIYVGSDSRVRRPEDLAAVEIAVGFHSGSHFSTLQALEPILGVADIRLRFSGEPNERLDQMLNGQLEAADVFGPPAYVLEQHGFRKVLDTSFIVAFLVSEDADPADVERYVSALLQAQRDIDLDPHRYKHYYLRELPEHLLDRVDVRAFGPGERIVAEPYPREVFEQTQGWLEQVDVLGEAAGELSRRRYEEAVLV